MAEFLAHNGIQAKARYVHKGSMKGTWQLCYKSKVQELTQALVDRLVLLGLTNYDGTPLRVYYEGRSFDLSVRGHDEFLTTDPDLSTTPMEPVPFVAPSWYKAPSIPEDLEKHHTLVAEVRRTWRGRCAEYVRKHGDKGTCVMGASIGIELLLRGRKNPISHTLINVSDICYAQGSLVWEDSVDEMLTLLRDAFPSVQYNPGSMN